LERSCQQNLDQKEPDSRSHKRKMATNGVGAEFWKPCSGAGASSTSPDKHTL